MLALAELMVSSWLAQESSATAAAAAPVADGDDDGDSACGHGRPLREGTKPSKRTLEVGVVQVREAALKLEQCPVAEEPLVERVSAGSTNLVG